LGPSTTNGVEPTFVERFVAFFHIPYFLGSLIWTIILGPPGALLISYVDTNNLDTALAITTTLFFGSPLSLGQNLVGLSILFAFFVYVLYMIRYMRSILVDTKPHIMSLLPKGEAIYDTIFNHVTRSKLPIVFGSLFMGVFALQTAPRMPPNFEVFSIHPANIVFLCLSYPFWFIIFTTFVWVYLGSIRGLHTLGQKPLMLKSFDKDKMLGVKPIGSLSLSLTFTYFGAASILALLPIVLSPDIPSLSYVVVVATLILVGILFFFLPLNTIHKKMLEVKEGEQKLLHSELSKVIQDTSDSNKENVESTVDIKESLNRLISVLKVEVMKDEVKVIPTWPIDMQILNRLLAMALSILGIILANFIMKVVLHFP